MGAENWLRVVGEPGYPLRDPHCFKLNSYRLEAIRGLSIGSFVSLGPGDGRHDAVLLTSLENAGTKAVNYIPIEISRKLLELTIQNLRAHVSIPIALQSDFEEDQDFIWRQLSEHARRPIIFSLLGGTVGNLDTGETRFFAAFRSFMGVDDAFLLDLPLAGAGWTLTDEPRLSEQGYTTAFRHFLAGGASRMQELVGQDQLDKIVDSFVSHLDSQIRLQHHVDTETQSQVITITDRTSQRLLLTLRRYRWQPMLDWFTRHGFEVAFAKSSLLSDQDKFGMGVVLLTPA